MMEFDGPSNSIKKEREGGRYFSRENVYLGRHTSLPHPSSEPVEDEDKEVIRPNIVFITITANLENVAYL